MKKNHSTRLTAAFIIVLCLVQGVLAQEGERRPVVVPPIEKGKEYYEVAVNNGDLPATVAYAKLLLLGKELPKDTSRGILLLREAVSKNDANAQLTLGDILIRGLYDTPRSVLEGTALLEAASASRNDAKLKLAEYLLLGRDLVAQPLRARSMLTELSNLGVSRASFLLGDALLRGDRGLLRDSGEGLARYELAIDAGSLEAMEKLGGYFVEGRFIEQDLPRGLDLLQKAADSGNSTASFRLGSIYLRGNDLLSANEVLARQYFDKAIEAGNLDAITTWGDALARGIRVPADEERGVSLLQDASDRGFTRATFLLGQFYLRRAGSPEDAHQAEALLAAAANEGWADSALLLGESLMKGSVIAADRPRGLSMLQRLSDAGNARATLFLGEIYLRGLYGEPKQPERGRSLLHVASDNGVAAASRVLGESLLFGEDVTDGINLLTQAADHGDARAAYRLGSYYLRLTNASEADVARGVEWLRKGASGGDGDAMARLGEWLLKTAPDTAARNEGLDALKTAAEKDVPAALYTLGIAYLDAQYGLDRDVPTGLIMIKKAADRGHTWAKLRLASAYLNGDEVSRNPAAAEALMEDALSKGNDFAVGPLAGLYFNGTLNGRRDNDKALDILDTEAHAGNITAIQQLLSIYGDGKWNVTEPVPARWREYYNLLKQTGREDLVAAEDCLAAVRLHNGIADFSRAEKLLAELPSGLQRSTIARMVRVNPNAYVYIIQSRLRGAGRFSGSVNGQLGSSTIRAMNEACRTLGPGSTCLAPLTAATASYLISYL